MVIAIIVHMEKAMYKAFGVSGISESPPIFQESIIFDNRTQMNADNQDFEYKV